nr:hypothetical protein [Kouleothrix sp.]
MQRVSEHVDAAYLEQPAPRPIPPGVILNLLNDYAFEQPLRTFLHPIILISLGVLIALYLLRASPLVRALPVL